ncbi:MAG: methyltransferase, partial [Armatimonadota bacterium]
HKPLTLDEFPVNRIVTGKKPITNQLLGICQPGKNNIVWVTVNGFPVLDTKGEITEIVISFIDITQRKKAEEELKKARKEAELANVEPVKLDLEQQEWQGEPFDVIVSNMVLHHIQNVELVVRRMAGALVEGGWLAFADLDGGSEDFHADNTGIMHFGFDKDQRQALCQQAWLTEIRTVEALRIPRDGKEFPVLLTLGRK